MWLGQTKLLFTLRTARKSLSWFIQETITNYSIYNCIFADIIIYKFNKQKPDMASFHKLFTFNCLPKILSQHQ